MLKVFAYEPLDRNASNRSPKNKKLWEVGLKLENLQPRDQKVVLRTIDALAHDADERA